MVATRVTIHHEGSGAPTDFARGAEGGYSAWIGTTKYTILRSPDQSYGTLHFNHGPSYDVCLSGNRHKYSVWQRILGVMKLTPVTAYPVTDNDINLIRAACADARARGWLVASPLVVFHHDSYGSTTVCPGNNTYARQNEIIAACQAGGPVPAPKPVLVPTEDEEDMIIAHGPGGVYVLGGATPIKVASAADEVELGKILKTWHVTADQLANIAAAAK
jgi:hypothetical protein